MIDLALSAVARGRIMIAAREAKPIPEGWAIDREGRPTTDARAALEGSMLPAGGVKGAMLALTIELLVVALSGAAYGFESDSFFVEEGRPTRIGQAFFKHLEDSILRAESYRGKVLSLEQEEHSYSGEASGITVHRLRAVVRVPRRVHHLFGRGGQVAQRPVHRSGSAPPVQRGDEG